MSDPEDLMKLGGEAYSADNYRKAVRFFLAARRGFVQAGSAERLRACDFVTGIALQAAQKWRQAVEAYDRCIATSPPDIRHADCLSYSAGCLDELRDVRGARARRLAAVPMFRDLDEPMRAGKAGFNAAISLMEDNLHEDAVTALEAAVRDFRLSGEREFEADALVYLGESLRELNRLAPSAARYREARPIYLDLGQLEDAARCAMTIADVERDRGHFAEALEMLNLGRAYFAEHGSSQEVHEIDMLRAVAMSELGDHEQALATIQSVETTDDLAQEDISGAYADLLHGAGRPNDAIAAMLRVRDFKMLEGDWHSVAVANLSLGSAYDSAGRPDESLRCFLEARDWFRANGFEEERLQAELGMGMATKGEDTRDSLKQTLEFEVASRNYARDTGDLIMEAQAENLIGTTLGHLEEPAAALEHYERAHAIFDQLDDREWAARLSSNEALAHQMLAGGIDTDPLKRATHLRLGLGCALGAALYLDSVRYTFASQAARREWAADTAVAMQLAFELADAAGDARTVADLVTLARSTGVMRPAPAAASNQDDIDSSPWSPRGIAGSTAPAAVRLLGATNAALDPPPIIVMPGGRVALRAALDSARTTYRVELDRLRHPVAVEL